MTAKLCSAHEKLHNEAVELCARHRRLEAEIVAVINAIDEARVYRALGQPSLFQYCVAVLGLSEAVAYAFISVGRKGREHGELAAAIAERRLSVAKAARVVAALSRDNAAELVAFAERSSAREIDREVARLRPGRAVRDRIRPVSAEASRLEGMVSAEVAEKLRRAQSLLSTKLGRAVDFNETLDWALGECLERHDPVAKAERAAQRAAPKAPAVSKEALCTGGVRRRVRVKAAERHAVVRRDVGRCTFVDRATGERCRNDRWLELHHLHPVSQGGDNSAENLRMLCAAHHDLLHEMELPLADSRARSEYRSGP